MMTEERRQEDKYFQRLNMPLVFDEELQMYWGKYQRRLNNLGYRVRLDEHDKNAMTCTIFARRAVGEPRGIPAKDITEARLEAEVADIKQNDSEVSDGPTRNR